MGWPPRASRERGLRRSSAATVMRSGALEDGLLPPGGWAGPAEDACALVALGVVPTRTSPVWGSAAFRRKAPPEATLVDATVCQLEVPARANSSWTGSPVCAPDATPDSV